MVEDIRKLRDQVDFIVMSVHWGIHLKPGVIAAYQVEAGHAAIDAGVDVILGHGCNMLKGVEFYKGKPIIYSMSTANTATKSGNQYDPSSHPINGGRTYFQNAGIMKVQFKDKMIHRVSMIPCDIENTKLTLEPIPRSHPRAEIIRQYMEWVCENNAPPGNHYAIGKQRDFPQFATDFSWDGDEILIRPRESV
jgi:poly-gamma-glutamate synthesis protein (capsule biosynthesis protein)